MLTHFFEEDAAQHTSSLVESMPSLTQVAHSIKALPSTSIDTFATAYDHKNAAVAGVFAVLKGETLLSSGPHC